MPSTPFAFAPRAHAPHAAAACVRVKAGAPARCPRPAALETFGFPAVPVLAVRGTPDATHTS